VEIAAMTIGYVGLGNMGGALARRLQRQHPLLVHDADEVAMERAVAHGSTPCAKLADLAARCEVILLCLPTSEQVRAVLFGANGIAAAARPGTLIVDQTSGEPSATRAMAAQLAASGLELIDAPVSGGPGAADAGTIAIMVGATAAQYARAEPMLLAISPNVFHVGPVGSGHVIKLANSVISATNRAVSLEAVALAAKNGIDPRKAVEIILASSGRNSWLERFMASDVLSGKLASGFTLGTIHKDLRAATHLGLNSDVPMFLGNIVREFYQMCINELGRDAEGNAAALVMDRLAGTQMCRAPPA